MLKASRKALSLQLLTKHQERIKDMVSRIEKYKPKFQSNQQYSKIKRERIEKRMEERQRQSDKLFQQNMKLIYRIETTGPKIQTKKFPEVKQNPKRLKSLSLTSKQSSRHKFKIKDVFRNEEELFEENIKLITNIECTAPKVQCWIPKKVRKLNELIILKKKEEEKKIIDKFKEISKEFTKLNQMRSFRHHSSASSIKSNSKSVLQ